MFGLQAVRGRNSNEAGWLAPAGGLPFWSRSMSFFEGEDARALGRWLRVAIDLLVVLALVQVSISGEPHAVVLGCLVLAAVLSFLLETKARIGEGR